MQEPPKCTSPSRLLNPALSLASLHDSLHSTFKNFHPRNLLFPDLWSVALLIPFHPPRQKVICLFWFHIWRDCANGDMRDRVCTRPISATTRVVFFCWHDTDYNSHHTLVPDHPFQSDSRRPKARIELLVLFGARRRHRLEVVVTVFLPDFGLLTGAGPMYESDVEFLLQTTRVFQDVISLRFVG